MQCTYYRHVILRQIMQFSPPHTVHMHTHELQPIKQRTGVVKIGEECAGDMHKGQCGYQVALYILTPLFPVRLKEIVQLYM